MRLINNPFCAYSKKSEDELESYYLFIGAEKFPILAKYVDNETKSSIRRMFELLFKCELKEDADCSFSVNEDNLIKFIQCPIDLTQQEKEDFLK